MLVQSQDVDNISWSVIHSGDLATAVLCRRRSAAHYWKDGSVVVLQPSARAMIFLHLRQAGDRQIHIFRRPEDRAANRVADRFGQIPLEIDRPPLLDQ